VSEDGVHSITTKSELLQAELRLSDNVVYRDFASETVVLNLQTGQYHGLNPTAGEMLAALDETGSIELAANRIAERHEVDLSRVQNDLCDLCERFMQRGLIAVVPAS
jgi:hypothetical protein